MSSRRSRGKRDLADYTGASAAKRGKLAREESAAVMDTSTVAPVTAVSNIGAPDIDEVDLPAKRVSSESHSSNQQTQSEELSLQPCNPANAVNIAVASRALFNLDLAADLFKDSEKLDGYVNSVVEHETEPFPPGAALPFINALSAVNRKLLVIDPDEKERFNVILMSHNHAHVGVRLINSINHHNLHIERMCLTGGATPVPHYLEAYNVSLFLTSYPHEVERALDNGYAAAAMSDQLVKYASTDTLKVAFDLDAVLFSDEAERQYKSGGLAAFFHNEKTKKNEPVGEGPLKNFAQALGRMQAKFKKNRDIVAESPIKVYIVTARSAASAGERAIKTLRGWGLHIDEIHFLAGAPKGPILNAIKPHIFFDDQNAHIQSAQEYGLPAAQVRSGISNESKRHPPPSTLQRNLSVIQCHADKCAIGSATDKD